MVSSGMGASEVCNLTWQDFLNAIEMDKYTGFDINELRESVSKKHYLIPTWYINRQKTSMPYFTFSSPESIQSIFTFLDERTHLKKDITSPKDSLFEFDGHKTNVKGMVAEFQRLNDKAGFGFQKGNRQRFFHSHALRKFFASTLKEAGLPEFEVNWMLGHRPPKISGIYIKPSVDVMKNEYRKLVPKISLEELNFRDIHTQEYDELIEILNTKEEQLQETLSAVKHQEEQSHLVRMQLHEALESIGVMQEKDLIRIEI